MFPHTTLVCVNVGSIKQTFIQKEFLDAIVRMIFFKCSASPRINSNTIQLLVNKNEVEEALLSRPKPCIFIRAYLHNHEKNQNLLEVPVVLTVIETWHDTHLRLLDLQTMKREKKDFTASLLETPELVPLLSSHTTTSDVTLKWAEVAESHQAIGKLEGDEKLSTTSKITISLAFCGFLITILFFTIESNAPSNYQNPPNIIFMLSDDQGYNSLKDEVTPFLRGLQSQGINLGKYYSQEACAPTRMALLTGRYPLSIGTYHSPPYDPIMTLRP